MPKNYEFFFSFFTNSSDGLSVSNQFLTFDHKTLTLKDIEKAELDLINKDPLLYTAANVINYILNKVTGDFDYRFLVHLTEHTGIEIIAAYDMYFDHQITVKSMHDDYQKFKDLFFKENDKNKRIRSLEILLHFENQTE